MSEEMQLPSNGWLQICMGCGIITSRFIPKKHYQFKKILNNSEKVYICFKCQKNKKIIKDIFSKSK